MFKDSGADAAISLNSKCFFLTTVRKFFHNKLKIN